MKDILIIAHFTQVPGESGNGRFDYIAEKLCKKNAKVEIVTSSFSHRTKNQRSVTKKQRESINYKLTMLKEPSYTENVSLKRFYSHYIFSKNIRKYLNNRKKPDIIYCSVPSLDVAKVAAQFASKNNIRFIIDVQDLWPEAFKMIFNVPIISDVIFYPMRKKAEYIYSTADEIIAVSQTYLDRALTVNRKCKKGYSVYLGTELAYFDRLAEQNRVTNKSQDEKWVAYIGTLGHSYDITLVIDALKILKDKGISNIKFIVMGDGPLKSVFENYAKKSGIYAKFTGILGYGKMVGILKECDIAVNPIMPGSAGSIINKVGDYAAAGLPVVNTQDSQEYCELIQSYNSGVNCCSQGAEEISKAIIEIIENENMRKSMGENNRKLAEEYFNRQKSYEQIIQLLIE